MPGWALIGIGLAVTLSGVIVALVLAEEHPRQFPWSTHDSLSATRWQCWRFVAAGLIILAAGYAWI